MLKKWVPLRKVLYAAALWVCSALGPARTSPHVRLQVNTVFLYHFSTWYLRQAFRWTWLSLTSLSWLVSESQGSFPRILPNQSPDQQISLRKSDTPKDWGDGKNNYAINKMMCFSLLEAPSHTVACRASLLNPLIFLYLKKCSFSFSCLPPFSYTAQGKSTKPSTLGFLTVSLKTLPHDPFFFFFLSRSVSL